MYCLIMHNRLRSAWITPMRYDPDIVKVLFCDEIIENARISVNDQKHSVLRQPITLSIIGTKDNIVSFKIYRYGDAEFLEAPLDSLCKVHEDILDAMESWYFVFSNEHITPSEYLDGYETCPIEAGLFKRVDDEHRIRWLRRMMR